jgi:N-acyl-D-amino-acid deacylase
VVFSLDRSLAPASFERPRLYAEGVDDVFVSGTAVLREGAMTGALPGRALRGPAWRPDPVPTASPTPADTDGHGERKVAATGTAGG